MNPKHELIDTLGNHRLFRGARPTSSDDLRGFAAVVSLEEGWFEFLNDQSGEEQDWCDAADAKLYHRPLSDIRGPTAWQLHYRIDLIKKLLKTGDVLIHCLHGKDRTGMVVAAWRITQDHWTVDHAKLEMYDKGFHRFPYWFWESALDNL